MSDIEEANVLRVLFDEVATRFDLVAHQPREPEIGARRILDVYADQQPPRWIHRRIPQLLEIHLAETLEAVDLDALLRQLDGVVPQCFEGVCLGTLLAKLQRERRQAAGDVAQ